MSASLAAQARSFSSFSASRSSSSARRWSKLRSSCSTRRSLRSRSRIRSSARECAVAISCLALDDLALAALDVGCDGVGEGELALRLGGGVADLLHLRDELRLAGGERLLALVQVGQAGELRA